MKETEAKEIVVMLKASTGNYPMGEQEHDFWCSQLQPLDADMAMGSLMLGIKTWKKFPAWAEFREIYLMEERKQREAFESQKRTEELPKFKTPEWVYVWWWSRNARKPRCLIPFPYQAGFVDETLIMRQDEYESLREEWVAAGAPTTVEEVFGYRAQAGHVVEDTIDVLKTVS